MRRTTTTNSFVGWISSTALLCIVLVPYVHNNLSRILLHPLPTIDALSTVAGRGHTRPPPPTTTHFRSCSQKTTTALCHALEAHELDYVENNNNNTNKRNENIEDATRIRTTGRVQGVTLKLALDRNGAIADVVGSTTTTHPPATIISQRFTCDKALDMVHRLRAVSDAVLVGKNTIVFDNPSLLVRRGIVCAQQPLRVIVDPTLSSLLGWNATSSIDKRPSYQIFSDGSPTVIYHSVPDVNGNQLSLDDEFVALVYMKSESVTGRIPASNIVQDLSTRFGVEHLMVEGGAKTAAYFLPVVDRCIIVRATGVEFQNPLLCTDIVSADALHSFGLMYLGTFPCGVDEIECWSKMNKPWPARELHDWP